MTINIIFDHPDFLVVNKPPQIAVQNETDLSGSFQPGSSKPGSFQPGSFQPGSFQPGSSKPGIIPLVCAQLHIDKLWLVHRLDKVTSGLLILAKNAKAATVFGEIFEQRQVEKYYLAISDKKPKKKQGSIKGGMHKVRDGKWILNTTHTNLAVSQFFSYSVLPNLRLFIVKPYTGKTHQIRVALKSLGSPILGDTLYKGSDSDRTYLHAYAIRFTYQDQDITLCCLPEVGEHFKTQACKNLLDSLDEPWQLNWPQVKAKPPQNES